jgi:hypothetical protein
MEKFKKLTRKEMQTVLGGVSSPYKCSPNCETGSHCDDTGHCVENVCDPPCGDGAICEQNGSCT